MRELTMTEKFDRIVTTESNRDYFKIINTSPLAVFEQDAKPGYEINTVTGELEYTDDLFPPVYPIRYGGSAGSKNTLGL